MSNEYFANISEVSRYFLVFFVRAALCRNERTINKAQEQANPEIPKYNDLLMLKPVADPTSVFSLKHLMAGVRCACKRQEVILDDIINYEVQTYVQKLIKKNFHPKRQRKSSSV